MKVYNINQIKTNDPLREKKINALNSVKDYLQGITDGKEANGLLGKSLWVKPELNILEKHLWKIIQVYKLNFQRGDSELQEVTKQHPDFENNWHEVIINANDGKEINKIKNVVVKALLGVGKELTSALIETREKTREYWIRTDAESDKARKGWVVLSPENSQVLREKLAKFNAKFFGNFKDTDWEKVLVRDILRDVLLAKIEEAEKHEKTKSEKGGKDAHNQSLKWITDAFRNAKFSKTRLGSWKIVLPLENYEEEHNISSFRDWVKQQIESDNLKEKWLPEGQKKADLLRKLEELIQAKTNDGGSNDSLSKNSSNASNDNSSKPSASEPVKNEWEKLVEETKNKAIKKIAAALQSAGLSKSDLNPKHQNWEQQIDLATKEGSATKIQDIESQLLADINNKKEVKEKGVELDNLLQKFSSQNKVVGSDEFKEALKKVNENLGDQNETKSREVKEVMREKDPTLYFETFVNWVKGEMKVCEMKNDELEEKERNLIEGKITDPNELKQIEKGLEEKVIAKSQSWSFSQKLSEWQQWLKEKAPRIAIDHLEGEVIKIKQQIYNLKLSSNSFKKQAYKNNEAKASQLLAELNAISQKKQSVSPSEKSLFRPSIVIPTALIGAGLIAIFFVIAARKRKLVKKQ